MRAMKVWTNGYGETVKDWEIGDRAMFTSSRWPELQPYEVTITAIYTEYSNGHPAYMEYTTDKGDRSGWQAWEQFAEVG